MGRRVLRVLQDSGFREVRLLRRDGPMPFEIPPAGWQVVDGTLERPETWAEALSGVDTVMHLAAATGRAPRRTHGRVNLRGTQALVEAARRAGVRRFLFVSSIAATYRQRPFYHYADAKAAAEALVRRSGAGLDWLIVRPTLVLGPGSPALASLRRLAGAGVPLMFGGGHARVQPIHVDDLARVLVAALTLDHWGGRTAELGGPELLTLQQLLGRIRSEVGRPPRGPLHLPLRPIRLLLGLVEPVLLPLLPFTAGQLALFANDSVAAADPLLGRLPSPRLGVAEMIGRAGVA